jgi:predicted nucleotidyltransferase
VTDQTRAGVVDREGERVLVEAVEAYRVALGGRLLAAYALGSLAHGGFSELVSDIDLGLIIGDPPLPADASMIQVVADAEKSKGSALQERLSVFWGTPATLRGEREGGRFPALDRLDLIENGRLLVGADDVRAGLPRPDVRELIVTGARFALDYLAGFRRLPGAPAQAAVQAPGDDAIEEILCPEVLIAQGVRRLTKLVLFPVRFLYTAATGRVGTNDAAAAWYLNDRQAPSSRLVAAALEWRTIAPADEANAALLLREHIVPLYLRYIDDYSARLDGLGEVELARAFQEWRDRLVR